ncbi:hypothetical protein CCR87_00600, partial [Rhodobaculum claviforme]|nr:hypothetical protein [Rhodobaculum claviforme]
METGTRISAVAHAGVLVWVAIGGAFEGTDRPDPAVAEVSLISAEAFAALSPPPGGTPVPPAAPQSR